MPPVLVFDRMVGRGRRVGLLAARVVSAVALITAGCGGGAGDHCAEEGERLASAHYALSTLAGDGEALYYLDWEDTDRETSRGVTVLTRLAKAGGAPEVLYRSDAEDAYARTRLAVDGGQVYFLDHCMPSTPTCARLFRIGAAGGPAELLLEDRIVDFAVAGELIAFSTSDENGLQEGNPDGAVWIMPRGGGEPTALAEGLFHLRDVEMDGEAVYFVDSGSAAPLDARIRKVPLAGGEPEMLAETGYAPPLAGQDAAHLYLLAEGTALRVPKTGGPAEPIAPAREHGLAAIALAEDTIYGTDPGFLHTECDDCPTRYECGEVVALTGGAYRTIAAETREAGAIHVDATHVYWTSYEGAIWRTPQ